ncbi:uncharacterized protein LOC130690168 [Daphnia carinata]|uniref:uncharacterized protein LOC130690168 n=1 Tax=Daphnia carinata TaxID=120202 RepID=UPI00258103D8|nr:uncharacterized protein LOC130690168 [Daphnia carinata]
MKVTYVVMLAFAALAAAEENKGVAAGELKKTVVTVEEPKEVREVKALPAYAFTLPYGFGYAASPYGFGYHSPNPYAYGYAPASFDATSPKFTANPFAFGAAPAKFAASPYGNAYGAAPYTYGYTGFPYGYGYAAPAAFGAAPAASTTAKLATQAYAPYVAAKQYHTQYGATYPYSAYHSPAFPYSYGYAASPYNFKFDGAKDSASTYQQENFPFAFPASAYAGFPFTLKE